jgi:hypothetical protein
LIHRKAFQTLKNDLHTFTCYFKTSKPRSWVPKVCIDIFFYEFVQTKQNKIRKSDHRHHHHSRLVLLLLMALIVAKLGCRGRGSKGCGGHRGCSSGIVTFSRPGSLIFQIAIGSAFIHSSSSTAATTRTTNAAGAAT